MRKIYGDISFQRFPITEKQKKYVNMTIKKQKALFVKFADIFLNDKLV